MRVVFWNDVPSEVQRLWREMDRFLAQAAQGGAGEQESTERQLIRPAVTVAEEADAWRASIDLPGVRPDGVELEINSGLLRIRAVRDERRGYERMLQLSDQVDTDNISADLSDGVLHLTLPKREQAKPRRIEIGAGPEQAQLESASA